ncbi:MAG: aspartate--ammonia ligase [Clostridia bacterium]|nr:aspartate--ammonia ligase [Clostridia bacterium]MBQ2389527.1 aspartate--ammonia ligase [Clostridia bacterium]MBQ5717406.1 aspartate--ammonia ligase [Clostridia bacterium]
MGNLILPKGYKSNLTLRETQRAIKLLKDTFQVKLGRALNLDRVTAPVIVTKASGINDDLNGIERKVEFDMKNIEGICEVVQSLAKWKRMALYRYGYGAGEGIFTDMNAIRRDDDCDNLHSIYVDQWDWEKVICREDRNIDFLKDTVTKIIKALVETQDVLNEAFPQLTKRLNEDVFFITTQELEDMYPDLTGKQRENEITKKHGTVFIMQIGEKLKSGNKHDGRAPDYDDWSLNGDILVWNDILNCAIEISSMGIRVDEKSLDEQLKKAGAEERRNFPYHKGILDGTLPLTIGGGIGQSRICLQLLEKAHIGEVQTSLWPEDMRQKCKESNIELL